MKSLRVTHIKKVPAEAEIGFEVKDPKDWKLFLEVYEKMFSEEEKDSHKIGFTMKKALTESAERWKDDPKMKEYAAKELKRQYESMIDLLKRVVNTVCSQTWEEKDEKAIFELTDEVEDFLTTDIFKKDEVEDEYFDEDEDSTEEDEDSTDELFGKETIEKTSNALKEYFKNRKAVEKYEETITKNDDLEVASADDSDSDDDDELDAANEKIEVMQHEYDSLKERFIDLSNDARLKGIKERLRDSDEGSKKHHHCSCGGTCHETLERMKKDYTNDGEMGDDEL